VIKRYINYFISFSITGWILEVITYFLSTGTYLNCGMFHGPWIPIYGWGGLFIIAMFYKYKDKFNPVILFLMCGISCSILEYITSWVIEETLNIKWWDYSDMIFNLNGRICLFSFIIFGLLGVFAIKFYAPFLDKLLAGSNKEISTIVLLILAKMHLIEQEN
jgi:uncharacterized membrane protein